MSEDVYREVRYRAYVPVLSSLEEKLKTLYLEVLSAPAGGRPSNVCRVHDNSDALFLRTFYVLLYAIYSVHRFCYFPSMPKRIKVAWLLGQG